ncbi:MAG: GNAT family N-acetyltransferase [Oscillospiraceae bacterium]|nr:GNAT family N-acetyltransferase [Oscillospiraceae bacterium]
MLQWMHDTDAVAYLQGHFLEKTLADCLNFIACSQETQDHLHLAIADDEDVYLGTVSLKHIDRQQKDGEFAIAIHPDAMGTGCARWAMEQILHIGLTELGLHRIFWCVSPENRRAVRFYEKGGYNRTKAENINAERYYAPQLVSQLLWYCVQDAQGEKQV